MALFGAFAVAAAPPAAADDTLDGTGLEEFHGQPVDWAPCPREEELDALLAGLECADIVVPLDYGDPDGDRIRVALSRSTATDPAARRGIILFNPGGPGGDGRWMPAFYQEQPIARSYDLIGFDPRGVGASTQLNCSVPDGYEEILPSRPTNAQLPLFTTMARDIEKGCDRTAGAMRPHVNTPNTARDMDVIRAALGEEKTNYVGYSYGTYLGAVYGTLFPHRLDRSVLDSSVHPDRIWHETWLAMSPAYTENVERFAGWAAQEGVGLGDNPEEVHTAIEEIADQLHRDPIDEVDRTIFDQFVGVQGRYQDEWDLFADILVMLREGSVPEAADAAEAVTLSVGGAREELMPGVYHTVACEADYPRGIGSYYRNMREYREKHPYGTGVHTAAPSNCTFRSFTPPEPPVVLQRDGYRAGIVIQAEYDPQTVYDGGPAMAKRLRNNLVIVSDEGGHGFYGMPGHECVTAKVNDYLMNGVLPASASKCDGLPRPDTAGPSLFSRPSLADRMRDTLDERPGFPTR